MPFRQNSWSKWQGPARIINGDREVGFHPRRTTVRVTTVTRDRAPVARERIPGAGAEPRRDSARPPALALAPAPAIDCDDRATRSTRQHVSPTSTSRTDHARRRTSPQGASRRATSAHERRAAGGTATFLGSTSNAPSPRSDTRRHDLLSRMRRRAREARHKTLGKDSPGVLRDVEGLGGE
ncbi:hypothetical protein CONPUDRAFT_167770 [Coniophora puteana RWD-64-598 SS2]|uniref:Uncharacterized protein n=1 Tax=Coniophora puteana (strain RWD-64-598) TaxID=741705 RepID=A0A5M3MEU5_CONPW|nr:uncharacterized protein CONPUDRAFT_167770 [Coniophora puteana RWD-64-598 SS2]EIW77673.1 hypothetical protein CONPUDRAFT_167770 [Coniophora puteana RWD-64-598 SS2]